MPELPLTRRMFLAGVGAATALTLVGCGGGGSSPTPTPQTTTIYRLSGRGRRISNAAKSNNANLLFATPEAALAHLAHPGDTSRVVSYPTSRATWERYFGAGNLVADLRKL